MSTTQKLEELLTNDQLKVFASLSHPVKIQAFLDETPYSPEDANRCPVSVMRDNLAHCLDGGLFAAAALRRIGYPPIIIDLLPEPGIDDDHVLAIYKKNGCIGAIAKSNFSGLRFREAVYRSLRELVMSYFEDYFNINGVRSLRGYTRPIHLAAFDHLNWETEDEGVNRIEKYLKTLRPTRLFTSQITSELSTVDKLSYQAGMLGTNPDGLYKPNH
jgi:hypothetical protein